ncbi:ABC transporter permease [Pseudomonas fluorescens]|uniref:ABC transporter permease n=1 Tax=Pseudomonas fluorescens TaxID=294 RepID=UPI001BE8FF22|nr:ABC-2 transporter permease [Pseudomonas fluorescens]MBT2374789.1 ABC transporter permease [Pseudomonas fluorescens]
MKLLPVIFKRQLGSYFSSPATYLCIAAFLLVSAIAGFQLGSFLEHDSNDLYHFFRFHPWFYLFLIPALCTQLWSDEGKEGAFDFLNTLPINVFELTLGKFLAAWTVSGLALLLTFPIVITVNYLGSPENKTIVVQLFVSWLLAGTYLAGSFFICALTCHRLIILILTFFLLLAASGLSSVLDAFDYHTPVWLIESLISLNPSARFDTIGNGVLTLQDLSYFLSMILAFLAATIVTLKFRKG